MVNTTTMLVHTRELVRDFLYQYQDENREQKVGYVDEIFLGVSSTITTYSLHLRFLPMDRIFTPYRWKILFQTIDLPFSTAPN
jgi:hypothetical protein